MVHLWSSNLFLTALRLFQEGIRVALFQLVTSKRVAVTAE